LENAGHASATTLIMWQDPHKESRYVMEQPVMLSMAQTRCHLSVYAATHGQQSHSNMVI